jgi:putative GTP pyrophosphokinase
MARARRTKIDTLIAAYAANKPLISQFQSQLLTSLEGSSALMQHVHSTKARLKDPEHLRDKLERRVASLRREKQAFDVTTENLITKINDLAGIRILHLYTRQIAPIDAALRSIFEEQRFGLLEGPFARTWDDESRTYFAECGIQTQMSPSLYTSVHYVVGSASRTKVTCEIQVRTLMEEVWGEVDHLINYPHKAESLACREQLKVLARVTSSATRLVDSIFMTLDDHARLAIERKAGAPRRRRRRNSA